MQAVSVRVETLQCLCEQMLCRDVEEVLAYCRPVLPILPSNTKAALLAAAIRDRVLDDEALLLLTDDACEDLDLRGCEGITQDGFAAALRHLPRLRRLDISYCEWAEGAACVLQAAERCPHLSTLKCSGLELGVSGDVQAVMDCLPSALAGEGAPSESWEDLESDPPWRHKLSNLRALHWRGIPAALRKFVAERCPKVTLADTGDEGQPPLPAQHAAVSGGHRSRKDEIPICERFRFAYALRQDRLRAKRDKEARRLERKQSRERHSNGTTRALERWLDEM